MKSKKASVFTLGCRLNQYETEILVDQLTAKGFEIVPWSEAVSAKNGGNAKSESLENSEHSEYSERSEISEKTNIALGIINTCAVTGLAEAKCRQIIRNFIKANPRAFCVVAGCYSQTNAEAVAKIAGVDLVVGNDQKLNLLDFVPENLAKNAVPAIYVGAISKQNFSIPFVPATTNFTQRANLKIQDGCNFMCSYCLIPKARGRARSRDFDDLLAEARSLVARGVRELILTGVNIGTYNFGGKTIVEIVDELAKIPHLARIRIGSIEPMTIPDTILDRMADENHPLMPFLHVPIQSACDRVLRDMHRHYNVAEFLDFLRRAVQRVPALTVGTDIMVGFPGETNEEFAQTCDNFMQNPFAFCHVFTYSERAGTPAARRIDQVDVPVRQRRSVALRALSSKKRREFMKQFVGKIVEVLFENPVPAKQITPAYTRNYLRVFVAGTHKANTLARVKLLKIDGDAFIGEIVPVGIFGAGISGNAVREFLQNVAGTPSEIFDVKTQNFDEKIAANFERIIFSPAFPPNHEWLKIARERGLECLTELDFAAENLAGTRLPIPLICVTGTNGKTTLTEFLAFALTRIGVGARAVGNNGIVFTKVVEEICRGNIQNATVVKALGNGDTLVADFEICQKVDLSSGDKNVAVPKARKTVPESENSIPENSVPAISPELFLPSAAIEVFRGKNLQHWSADKKLQFITFHLADSLPQEILQQFQAQKDEFYAKNPQPWSDSVLVDYHKLLGKKIEKYLEAGHGSCVLANKKCQEILAEVLFFENEKKYRLHAFVIMPNHVHVLVEVFDVAKIGEIVKSWKGVSANKINKILSTTGTLWRGDYHDRVIRSELHYQKVLEYIRNNRAPAARHWFAETKSCLGNGGQCHGNGDTLVADSKICQKVDLSSGDKSVAVPKSENSVPRNPVPANSVPATIVCETSSFQAEVLQKLVPAAVLWTNIDEDHIDRHGSLENYFRAKFHLVERLAPNGICVIGESVAEKAREFKIAFPQQTKIATRAELLDENCVPAGTIFETFPQMENFAIARKFWRERGLPLEELLAAAREFKPRDHRLAKVKTFEFAGTQIEFWDDSKGTNFHAVYAALRSFAGTPILWIGGGLGKGGDIAHFARTLAGTVVEAFLIGETAAEIDENFRAAGTKSTIFASLQNAVEAARERAFELAGTFAGTQNPRVIVLFSPGFASFDMFKSYADRGRQFVKIVENL